MKTDFTIDQLKEPYISRSEAILQDCVHCGMCTATCPSYKILGNELDSPRGRIYLIKSLLESGRQPDAQTVKHIDQCLSCLACTTTCPSGVDYMHLIDDTRAYIEKNYKRPIGDRVLRYVLSKILPFPKRFKFVMRLAQLGRPFRKLFWGRYHAMLTLAPFKLPATKQCDYPQTHPSIGQRKKRVAILPGCAQSVLDPGIQRATISVLTRLGVEVVHPENIGCCGALVHHMGKEEAAIEAAKANIKSWLNCEKDGALDAIIITTSGCGTTVKDYGHMLANTDMSQEAEKVSRLAKDVTEFLIDIFPTVQTSSQVKVGYHAACSLQHGQRIVDAPKALLIKAGFKVQTPAESHLCCGSAGTYNIMQPKIAQQLGERKANHLQKLDVDVVAAGNIGCMTQIGLYANLPIVHIIELLNWALGGKKPF